MVVQSLIKGRGSIQRQSLTAEDPKWIIFFKTTGFSKGFRGLALQSTVSSVLAPLPSLLPKRLSGTSSHVGCKRHLPEFMRGSLSRR